MGQPDVSANGRTTANGDAAKDWRARIYDSVVLDDGVSGNALDQSASLVHRESLGAESDRLVQLHALANDRGLADDGAVIDEEAAVDLRPWMDVDPLRKNARSPKRCARGAPIDN